MTGRTPARLVRMVAAALMMVAWWRSPLLRTARPWSPSVALPQKVIILLNNSCGDCTGLPANVGLQASYKEFKGGEFIEEPAAEAGIPAVGANPVPKMSTSTGRSTKAAGKASSRSTD